MADPAKSTVQTALLVWELQVVEVIDEVMTCCPQDAPRLSETERANEQMNVSCQSNHYFTLKLALHRPQLFSRELTGLI